MVMTKDVLLAISQKINKELEDFCGNQNRQDDITLVVVKIAQ